MELIGKINGDASRQNGDIYRKMFDSSPDCCYWIDATGVIRLINMEGARLLGHDSPAEVIGKPASSYWKNPRDRDEYLRLLRQNKTVKAHIIRCVRADGSEIDIEDSCNLIESSNGAALGMVGIFRDCTERRKTENELILSRARLIKDHKTLTQLFRRVEAIKMEWEMTLDCAGDMIILADENGRIKRCNKSLKDFIGKPHNELLGQDWSDVLAERNLRTDMLYADGVELFHEPTKKWFAVNTYPFKSKEPSEINGDVIVMHDTTELKKMTIELEGKNRQIDENREKLQDAMNNISSLIRRVVDNKDLSVRFINPNLKTCRKLTDCVNAECPCFGEEAMRCWQYAGTFSGGRPSGSFAEKLNDCSECEVFREATRDPIYLIGEHFNNMMHILERKSLQLESANAEIKNAQSQILQQEKMASIGQLAAGVAHEINNPMGFISSNLGSLEKYVTKLSRFVELQTEALSEPCASKEKIAEVSDARKKLRIDFIVEDIKDLIRESLDGAERVKKIVQDLKSFSRVDEAEIKLADVNAGIESTINIVWNELKYKASVTREYGEIPPLKCNPGQLNQVIMNLLVNAAQAIEKQGEIKIKTWSDAGSIFISISDNGCGIPKDRIDRIFDPFFTTKAVGKGTGLGLSIAYDIIKKHCGEIGVESSEGSGTVFTIRLPHTDK